MRDFSPRLWQCWRVTLSGGPTSPAPARFGRVAIAPPSAGEAPGPDGIRHALVARIRLEIAAGTYDTEEKWLAAEEELLRRVTAR